jgi:hypothetical protein
MTTREDIIRMALVDAQEFINEVHYGEWPGPGGRRNAVSDKIQAAIAAHEREKAGAQAPVDMVLHCPKCHTQHIDAPEEPSKNDGVGYTEENGLRMPIKPAPVVTPMWTNPPHKSHLCHGCGHIWRPSDTPTNGVKATASGKDADTAPSGAQALREAAYEAGWRAAADWCGENHIIFDIGSRAYLKDRDTALRQPQDFTGDIGHE